MLVSHEVKPFYDDRIKTADLDVRGDTIFAWSPSAVKQATRILSHRLRLPISTAVMLDTVVADAAGRGLRVKVTYGFHERSRRRYSGGVLTIKPGLAIEIHGKSTPSVLSELHTKLGSEWMGSRQDQYRDRRCADTNS